jgi:hypothetical protein
MSAGGRTRRRFRGAHDQRDHPGKRLGTQRQPIDHSPFPIIGSRWHRWSPSLSCMPDKDADDLSLPRAGVGALTSGCDGDGQKLRRPDFLGNGLALGLKT